MGKYNLTYVCSKCSKDFDEGQHPGYFIVFNKCRDKTCPDCGRVRKLGRIKCLYENLSRPGSEGKSLMECMKCKEMTEFFFNGVCPDCFCEVQKEKNSCVCPLTSMKEFGKVYYCSFCEEFHGAGSSVVCKECAKKQDVNVQRKEAFFSVGLPSAFVGIVIGFFLGWLFLVKLRRKKPKKPNISFQ